MARLRSDPKTYKRSSMRGQTEADQPTKGVSGRCVFATVLVSVEITWYWPQNARTDSQVALCRVCSDIGPQNLPTEFSP